MAKPILVANWKNHPSSLSEAQTLLKNLARKKELFKKVALFIAPPFTYFESVSERLGKFGNLATQNISSLPRGNFTGQVTSDILKSFGVKLAIVGHSERRAFGETAEHIAEKVKMALNSGIAPLVCVGEIVQDKDGEHFELLRDQIKSAFAGLNKNVASKLVIAYEPVWAIGKSSKNALGSSELSESVIFIKKVLTELFGRVAAEKIPILYGGSVEPSNARELLQSTGIRGFLVGHVSLNAKNFEAIVKDIISK